LWQLGIVVLGIGILGASMQAWGVVVHSDSVDYQVMSRCITEDSGSFIAVPDCHLLILHYPPLFPLVIAAIKALRVDFMSGVGWLNMFLFGCNVFIAGFILKEFTRSVMMALAGSFLMAIAPDMLDLSSQALTEPLFLFFTYLTLLGLILYLKKGCKRVLLLAAILASLAFLTRFAGSALIVAGTISIAFPHRPKRANAWKHALIFFCLGILPMGVWWFKNVLAYGVVIDRLAVFHPLTWESFREMAGVVGDWVVSKKYPVSCQEFLLAGIMAVFVMGGWRLGQRLYAENADARQDVFDRFSFLLVLAIIFYSISLVLTMTFLDGYMTFSHRYLLPIYVFGGGLFLGQLYRICMAGRSTTSVHFFTGWLILGYLAVFYTVGSVVWLRRHIDRGDGYASRGWRHSAVIQRLRSFPATQKIYSNVTTPIYILTGRVAFEIPWPVDPMNQQVNGRYRQELDRMAQELRQDKGVFVYFEHGDVPVESLENMKERLPLHLLERYEDGAIYKVD